MMIPTVKVRRDGAKGFRLINEADFDPERHDLFDAPKAKRGKAKAVEPEAPAADDDGEAA